MVPLCLMRTIWREGNPHTFEDVECMGLPTFAFSFFDWSRAWGFTHCGSIATFVD